MASPSTQAPALPNDAYIQLANLSTGWVYRVATDGRFLVTPKGQEESQQAPMSKLDRGQPILTEQGLLRLHSAVELAGFFTLADRVQGAPVPVDGETEAIAQDLAFTVRGPKGPKTVLIHGALALPATLGPLEPVFTALDLEALGGWANE